MPIGKSFEGRTHWKLITVNDIASKLSDLSNQFYDFLKRSEVFPSDLAITKNCNRYLTERVVQVERHAVTNAQYHQWESVKVNLVPPLIRDEKLKLRICRAHSLTGHEVKADHLQACRENPLYLVVEKCSKHKT